MFGGSDNNNPMIPVFMGNCFQYDANALPQLQLFGDFPVGCSADPLNYMGNEQTTTTSQPVKRVREAEPASRQQKLHISLNNNFLQDETAVTRTHDWVAGDNSAPVNKKMFSKELQNDSDGRKTLNLLRYEALKREMLLLTVGIGTFCSGYCFLALSAQAAMSYGTGVLFSCIYLQLLYKYVDNLSKEMVPQIFRLKKSKKIGIRSQDLKDMLERSVQGSGISLSSPRLVIPAAIYGLWGLSQHFTSDLFDFQLVPAMVGMFAYKAAALVQVYRDNEDLRLIFPEDGEGSSE